MGQSKQRAAALPGAADTKAMKAQGRKAVGPKSKEEGEVIQLEIEETGEVLDVEDVQDAADATDAEDIPLSSLLGGAKAYVARKNGVKDVDDIPDPRRQHIETADEISTDVFEVERLGEVEEVGVAKGVQDVDGPKDVGVVEDGRSDEEGC